MKTIVVIDDEPVIREMLVRHLEAQGWNVLEADNGDTGLALVNAHRPAAVVCDLLMPGTTGFNVCRAIRARRDQLGNVAIIVTTGSDFATDRQNALEAGANFYLIKPISPAEIIELLAPVAATFHEIPGPTGAPAEDRPSETTTLRFWGVRGSIATPGPETVRYGGNTSCVEMRTGGEIIVLDAGTGIRPLGESLRKEFAERPLSVSILLSHTHWDHIQGLPFFGPIHDAGRNITILGYQGAKQSLLKSLSAQMDSSFFPIGMDQLAGKVTVRELHELDFRVGHTRVQGMFCNHPGVTLGYRFCTSGGSVVFMPDAEIIPAGARQREIAAGTDGSATMDFAAYKNQLLAEFAQGAELFICDAQYTAEEYGRRVGWGHSCVDETVRLAIAAKVKRLILFHHDPTHDDRTIDRLVEHARTLAREAGAPLLVDAATEGHEISLPKKH